MAEYDAFGRKIGEDTLSGLGGGPSGLGSGGEARARPAAPDRARAPVSEQWQFRPPASRPPAGRPPRRRRGRGCAVGLGVLVMIAAVLVVSVGALVSSVSDTVDEALDSPIRVDPRAPERPATGESEGGDRRPAAPARPPRGLRRGSLLLAGNLRPALRRLRREGGRLEYLRLAPDRINAQLVSGRRIKHVSITHDGDFSKYTSAASGLQSTVPFSTLRPDAPERMVRAAARQLRRSPDRVDYLLFAFLGTPAWGAYFKGGAYFRGDAAGRALERVS